MNDKIRKSIKNLLKEKNYLFRVESDGEGKFHSEFAGEKVSSYHVLDSALIKNDYITFCPNQLLQLLILGDIVVECHKRNYSFELVDFHDDCDAIPHLEHKRQVLLLGLIHSYTTTETDENVILMSALEMDIGNEWLAVKNFFANERKKK